MGKTISGIGWGFVMSNIIVSGFESFMKVFLRTEAVDSKFIASTTVIVIGLILIGFGALTAQKDQK